MHVDTAALLKAYGAEAELAPINTGSAHVPTKVPTKVPKRGPDVFVALENYQFEEWQQKRRRSGEPVVELTLAYAVPGIANFVRRVELRQANDVLATVFEV